MLPHLVHTNDSGMKSVSYMGLCGYLIEEIKMLKKEVERPQEWMRSARRMYANCQALGVLLCLRSNGEFGKGNNLTDYYGVASGRPHQALSS